MNFRLAVPAALAALLLATGLPAHAEVYKWVDANGRVQFSDKPPPDQKGVKQLDLKEAPVSNKQRQEAEDRAARQKAAANSGRSNAQPSGEGDAKKDDKEPAKPATPQEAYQKSQECFAQYRNANATVRAEGYEKCGNVKDPN